MRNVKFNERLTRLREEKGSSKTYVAHALNLANMQTYANQEYGKREPDFNTVKQLADLFEVSLDYLLGKSDRKKAPSNDPKEVDLDSDPVILSYNGKPVSDEDMEIIKAILARHQKKEGQR